ncbi:isocitrate lyase/phosphoenolpyruvate mutase family protein [Massilia sp. W12]|uniref:isocitrate lyase/PEP mutase family protein n=1 Tax=Massilia sp. W12 TaxID=3126507 RepID=UPI0030CCF228
MPHALLQSNIATFKALHQQGRLLLPNAWDGMSVRMAQQCGAQALATTSAGIAWALGMQDGHRARRKQIMQYLHIILSGCALPVSVDIEDGLLQEGESMADLAADLLALSCAGVNLEDSRQGRSLPLEEGAARIAALRAAVGALDYPLFINARIDAWLRGETRAAQDLIARANAYFAAGADCVFMPGLLDLDVIRTVAASIDGPLSVMARPGGPDAAALFAAGACRVSAGSFFPEQAYSMTQREMADFMRDGSLQAQFAPAISYADLNAVLA